MDLEKQLMADLSKGNILYIKHEVLADLSLLDKLWKIVESSPAPLTMRAAWVIQHTVEEYPGLLDKYYTKIVAKIPKVPDDSTRKVLLKLILIADLKEKHIDKLYQLSSEYFSDPSKSLAVRAYSAEIMYKISLKYPELSNELLVMLDLITEDDAPAMLAKKRMLSKLLIKNIFRNEKQNNTNRL